ncbi:Excinuclease ABC, C subunit-like [hydrothermal vent metagenome]|uniref:Excinuclease ABC, C subunit-like n=1 Tax=hydrothermal vent metagenome TaxID=652676 RepID=A0A3B0W9G9_9ZZZZ
MSCIYILTNVQNTVLYIGVTSDLISRVFQHRTHAVEGFTKKYNVTKFVYFEQFEDMNTAIQREKTLKKWLKNWKEELVTAVNPNWDDLWDEIIQ